MAKATITRTTALYPRAVFLQWDVVAEESGSFFVDVARAQSPEGPWDVIASGLRDTYNFQDTRLSTTPLPTAYDAPDMYSLARETYYQITVTPPSGVANAFQSAPCAVEPGLSRRTRLLKRKILHDQAVGYRHLNGIDLVVLKRRRWGTRCRACYDAVTRQATLEHCTTCYGTSFEGGYWAPVLIRGRREAAAVESQVTSHGDSDVKYNDFNILDYPHIEYKDLIVDLVRNDRYQVQRVHQTELQSVTCHQKMTASLLGRNSVEYGILIDERTLPSLY